MSSAAADRLLRGDGAAGAVVSRAALMTLRPILQVLSRYRRRGGREAWWCSGAACAARQAARRPATARQVATRSRMAAR
jgi:hypothetical protein